MQPFISVIRPPGGIPFRKDIYLFGELTNYGKDPQSKMVFNGSVEFMRTSMWLKQGYYDYGYALFEGEGAKAIFQWTIRKAIIGKRKTAILFLFITDRSGEEPTNWLAFNQD